jgi:hypothetical protein
VAETAGSSAPSLPPVSITTSYPLVGTTAPMHSRASCWCGWRASTATSAAPICWAEAGREDTDGTRSDARHPLTAGRIQATTRAAVSLIFNQARPPMRARPGPASSLNAAVRTRSHLHLHGCEGRISTLKRAYGWDRTRVDSLQAERQPGRTRGLHAQPDQPQPITRTIRHPGVRLRARGNSR